MSYHGDWTEDSTHDFKFSSRNSSGPATLSGTPALSVYKANGTTQSTAGITLTVDFDSVTGLNHVRIDTSADAFYATGNDYDVVITTGTVGGVSVVGEVVGSFSIENRVARANVIQSLGVAVTNEDGFVVSATSTTVTLDAGTRSAIDDYYNDRLFRIVSGTGKDQMYLITDYVGATGVATVDTSVSGGDWFTTPDTTSGYIIEFAPAVSGAPSAATIADAVWDEALSGHLTAGSTGEALDAAGGGGTSPQLIQSTTIATLATQTSFTLTAGSADNDAYNGAVAIFTDQSTSTQKAFVPISDYVGSTKTVTLSAAPAFTIAVGDTVDIVVSATDAPTAAEIRAEIDSNSTKLSAIHAKLPSKTYLTGTANSDGDIQMDEATGNYPGSVGSVTGGINTGSGTITTLDLLDSFQDIQHGVTAGLITGLNNLSAAQVNAEVDTALADIHLDHLIASADPGGVVANSSFLAKLVSKSATPAFSSYDNTTDSLEAQRDNVGTAGAGLTAADDAVLTAIAAVETDTQDIQSRLPAALVSGRMDASVGAMAASVLTASALATDAAAEIADAVLSRNVSNVESSAGEHTICSIVLAMLESSIASTTWTIKRTDGTTTHLTKTVTTDASADPVTGVQ